MIWHFNQDQLDKALEDWQQEIHEDENSESSAAQTNIIREFLDSYTAREHELSHDNFFHHELNEI